MQKKSTKHTACHNEVYCVIFLCNIPCIQSERYIIQHKDRSLHIKDAPKFKRNYFYVDPVDIFPGLLPNMRWGALFFLPL